MKRLFLMTSFLLCFFLSKTNAQVSLAQKTNTLSTTDEISDLTKAYFSKIMDIAISSATPVKLYEFVYEWIGTPYRLGGANKQGIDCSKFAGELYDKVFNMENIGINAKAMYHQVMHIKKTDLSPGDLVFFRIRSRSITHVGVYIGDNKFAHASSSRGVMVSNLNQAYWKKYYYDSGRVLVAKNNKQPQALQLN